MPIENDEVFCILCAKPGKYKTLAHRNSSMMSSQFSFHSECIKRQAERESYNPINVLRLLNIPYVHSVWVTVEEDESIEPYDYITRYIKVIGPRRGYKDFSDSEYGTFEEGDKYHVSNEMISRWGLNLSDNDYIELEAYYQNLCELKQVHSKLEEDRYIANAWLSKRKNDALMSGSPADIKNMIQAYESDLKNIGLDTATVQGGDGKKTLGERIAQWEREGPTPEISEEFRDVDNIFVYFKRFFLYPLLRNFGKTDAKMDSYINDIDNMIHPGGDNDES